VTEHLTRDEVRHFTYTAQASQYRAMAIAIAVLGAIEASIVAIVLLFLVHGFFRAIVLAVGLVLYAGALSLLFSPLVTRHTLTPQDLILHLGLGFKAAIPRGEIALARRTDVRLPGFPGRVTYDRAQDVLAASMSRRDLILVQLIRPRTFKIWPLQRCETDRILLNVDEPEAFLLALGESPPQATASFDAREIVPLVPDRPTEASADHALQTYALTKHYGQHVGVEDLYLTVQQGEIYGLLGVNGAGKTTTLKMLVGLMQPTRGHVEICGLSIQREPARAKACLGYLAETTIVYEKLTGREFLEFMAELRQVGRVTAAKRVHELLATLDLVEWADQMIRVYSFGMRRKTALAGAVIHRPAVLVLDEPFNGLDPRSSRRVRDYLRQTRDEGTTVLVSTHNLAIAEEICDRIGIIDQGHLIAEGTATELRHGAQMEGSSLEDVFLRLTAEIDDSLVPLHGEG
jgi:ABC-2 type transport system ATP-binding protein